MYCCASDLSQLPQYQKATFLFSFTDPHYIGRPETGLKVPWVMDLTGNGYHARFVSQTARNAYPSITVPQSEWTYGGIARGEYSALRSCKIGYYDTSESPQVFNGRYWVGYVVIEDPNYDMGPFTINSTSQHVFLTWVAHDYDWWWSYDIRVDWYQYPLLLFDNGARSGPMFSGSVHKGRLWTLKNNNAWTDKVVKYHDDTLDGASSCYYSDFEACCPLRNGTSYDWCCIDYKLNTVGCNGAHPDFTLRHYEVDIPNNVFRYRNTRFEDNRPIMTETLSNNVKIPQTFQAVSLGEQYTNDGSHRHSGAWSHLVGMMGPTVFYSGLQTLSNAEEVAFKNFKNQINGNNFDYLPLIVFNNSLI